MAQALISTKSSSLYDRDFLLWIEETIAHLHTGDFKQLDINNLIEEIDSLGKAQKNALKGQIRALIEHIIKHPNYAHTLLQLLMHDRGAHNLCAAMQ